MCDSAEITYRLIGFSRRVWRVLVVGTRWRVLLVLFCFSLAGRKKGRQTLFVFLGQVFSLQFSDLLV